LSSKKSVGYRVSGRNYFIIHTIPPFIYKCGNLIIPWEVAVTEINYKRRMLDATQKKINTIWSVGEEDIS
jgi:hypothetical protein